VRCVSGVFALILALFAGVQYNDPDGPFWVVVYLVPAGWAAAVRPGLLDARLACFALAAVGTVVFWPTDPG
jgi:hypothetical protein